MIINLDSLYYALKSMAVIYLGLVVLCIVVAWIWTEIEWRYWKRKYK